MQMKLDAVLRRLDCKTFSIRITAKRNSFDHCQIRFLLIGVAGTEAISSQGADASARLCGSECAQ
jgi:hypothetical protein